MPLTSEENQYFKDGIDALLKKAQSKNTARSYVQDNLSPKEVLDKLTTLMKKDFIAAASAIGLQTPSSLVAMSNSDLAKVQAFVGYTPPSPYNPSDPSLEQPNIADTIKTLYNNFDYICAEKEKICKKLENQNQSITNIYNILNISSTTEAVEIHNINTKSDKALELLGTPPSLENPRIVTRCIFDGKSYKLGNVIAKSDASSFGITTALLACLQWQKTKEDHYLTSTGDVKDCSFLLPPSEILSECMGALGFSIDKIMD